MNITMLQAINLHQTCQIFRDKSMPIKTTYKMSKLLNSLQGEAEFYTAELNKLVGRYAEKDENGSPVMLESKDGFQIKPECVEDMRAAVNELWNLTVTLPEIKFTLDELGSINLSIEEFDRLLPFIDE